MDDRLGWLRDGNDRFSREVERNAEDVGILDVVETLGVEGVRLAAERAANNLLAEELRAEGADT